MRCPGDAILKTYDLARTLRNTDVTLVGGFQSPMEKDFWDLVLRGPSSIVVCPARGLGTMRIPKTWQNPLTEVIRHESMASAIDDILFVDTNMLFIPTLVTQNAGDFA